MDICPILIVLFFIALDFVTGMVKAFHKGNFNSSTMREGLFHKLGEVFALALVGSVQYSMPYFNMPVNVPLLTMFSGYCVLMEIGSIIENVGEINPELTKPLNHLFEKLKEGCHNEGN